MWKSTAMGFVGAQTILSGSEILFEVQLMCNKIAFIILCIGCIACVHHPKYTFLTCSRN